MRRMVAALLALSLALICVPAVADYDLAALSVDELRQLRDAVSLELAARCADDGALASWDTALAHVELLSVARGISREGGEGILLTFSFTNKGQEAGSFRDAHWVTVYQNGVECDRTIGIDDDMKLVDTWSTKVLPGAVFHEMRWGFQLRGESNTIDVEIEDRTGRTAQSAGIVTVALPD